jgi:hypothetical protein
MPAIVPNFGAIARMRLPMRFFGMLIFSIIQLHAAGQPSYADGNAGLRLNEVNSRAARHFLNHFPQASGVKWVRDDRYYIAFFNSDDSRTRVHYTNDGNFSFCLKYFPEGQLDSEHRSAILKIFPGCHIGVVTEFTDDFYNKSLFVHIQDGAYFKTLRFDDGGIEITENIKDAGI